MARSRESKGNILAGLQASVGASTAIIFANVKGMKVKDMETLRKSLRSEHIECMVAKKTLLDRAFSDAGVSNVEFKKMEGEIAVIFGSQDQVAPARIVSKLAKQFEPLSVIAGILRDAQNGNQLLSGKEINALAALPSRDELRAKLVGTLAAPMSGFVGVLNGSLRSLVQVLNAYSQSKS